MVAPFKWQLDLWAPPTELSGVEWGERHYRIPDRGNAEPGPWRASRTPFMREMLNKLCDSHTQYVGLCKGVQISGSTASRIFIGFVVDNWGDPVLLVYPTENSTKEQLKNNLKPLILDTQTLARWDTGERNAFTKEEIALAHMSIYPGWSGSAQTVASRPIRVVILDELDKMRQVIGEPHPDELADVRTTTFRDRRKVFKLSTPTTPDGYIWKNMLNTGDVRRWFVPCPHCNEQIQLEFENVQWEGKDEDDPRKQLRQIEALSEGRIQAYYQCQECGGVINERERCSVIGRGQWVSGEVDDLGNWKQRHPFGQLPDSVRIFYWIGSINSPWVGFNRLAAEFLKCTLRGDIGHFQNNYLAQPSAEAGKSVENSLILDRAEHAPFVAPNWATCIVAGADTQKDSFPYVIRAWGPGKGGMRSRLLDYGTAWSLSELKEVTIGRSFAVEGVQGQYLRTNVLIIDSGGGVELGAEAEVDGTTRDLVYQFALSDPQKVIPIKGHGGNKAPDMLIKHSSLKYAPRAKPHDPRNVNLQILDTQGLKDKLSNLIHCCDPILWEESTNANQEYADQMSSEAKALVKIGGRWLKRWKQKGRQANHWWDCSVYSLAGAMLMRADKRSPEIEAQIKATAAAPQRTNPVKQPDRYKGGWLAKRPRR